MITEVLLELAGYMAGAFGPLVASLSVLMVIAFFAVLCYYIVRAMLLVLQYVVSKTPTYWDDHLLNSRMMRAISQLAPAIAVSVLLPAAYADGSDGWVRVIDSATRLYILWAVVYIACVFVGNVHDALASRKELRVYAVKGVYQMIKLVFICVGIIIAISILVGKSPAVILTALGASAAVLMLVFKDTILGLVASVQLTTNKMLHRGDWIVADSHGANGEVEDISLTTVKVRNWDNSITTIPPYALVSESFRNYQPMRESGGRRVECSLYIDFNSIGFCDAVFVDGLRAEGMFAGDAGEGPVVNLTLFTSYLEEYIASSALVRGDMLQMVRQMPPTQSGLPLQVYFFTHAVEWKQYEHDKDLILTHIYASVRRFGLRLYQAPAGLDFRN